MDIIGNTHAQYPKCSNRNRKRGPTIFGVFGGVFGRVFDTNGVILRRSLWSVRAYIAGVVHALTWLLLRGWLLWETCNNTVSSLKNDLHCVSESDNGSFSFLGS
jgi:hypothetical protein